MGMSASVKARCSAQVGPMANKGAAHDQAWMGVGIGRVFYCLRG